MKENKGKKSSKKISRKKSKKGIGDLVIFWTVVVLVAIGFIMIFFIILRMICSLFKKKLIMKQDIS